MESEEHKAYHRKLMYVFMVIVFLFFGGSFFYYEVEKWRFIDAMYFSAYTMTTVGYGDITPKTDLGKLFTIGYLFTSVSIALYGLTLFAGHFLEAREEVWYHMVDDAKENTKFLETTILNNTKNIESNLRKLFTAEKPPLKKN